MIEPATSTMGNLQALLDSKIDAPVSTMMSPRFVNPGITLGIVENPLE